MAADLTLEMYDALIEVEEFLEPYEDVVDGDYGAQWPNKAMSLRSTVLELIARYDRRKTERHARDVIDGLQSMFGEKVGMRVVIWKDGRIVGSSTGTEELYRYPFAVDQIHWRPWRDGEVVARFVWSDGASATVSYKDQREFDLACRSGQALHSWPQQEEW